MLFVCASVCIVLGLCGRDRGVVEARNEIAASRFYFFRMFCVFFIILLQSGMNVNEIIIMMQVLSRVIKSVMRLLDCTNNEPIREVVANTCNSSHKNHKDAACVALI